MTVTEYLRRIEPRQVDSKGRWKEVPEARLRAFAAVKDVLCAGGGTADFPTAVILTVRSAPHHGAEIKDVWRHVRRYRDQIQNRAEQLELPI